MLKVAGNDVEPFEVEGDLLTHLGVLDDALVAWPDEYHLIEPMAVVVIRQTSRRQRQNRSGVAGALPATKGTIQISAFDRGAHSSAEDRER
jgi:acyl-coenzyme A synthetase/AMP-(fatty) acid ligase